MKDTDTEFDAICDHLILINKQDVITVVIYLLGFAAGLYVGAKWNRGA